MPSIVSTATEVLVCCKMTAAASPTTQSCVRPVPPLAGRNLTRQQQDTASPPPPGDCSVSVNDSEWETEEGRQWRGDSGGETEEGSRVIPQRERQLLQEVCVVKESGVGYKEQRPALLHAAVQRQHGC